MGREELISVIIPVYKVEEYLDRCIESVVNQTFTNLEIILVEDGSPDRCPDICDKWAKKDTRIRVIHKINNGVSSARNVGLSAAKGKWISFIDSDDWIHPQYFDILSTQANCSEADIVAANYFRAKEIVQTKTLNYSDLVFVPLTKGAALGERTVRNYVWGKLYKKTLLKNRKFDEEVSFAEDFLFNISILIKEEIKVVYTKEPLYYWFYREDSAVNSVSHFDRLEMCEKYISIADLDGRSFVKRIFYSDAMKRALSIRYAVNYCMERSIVVSKCNKILYDTLPKYLLLRGVSIKEKSALVLFTFSPKAYRKWRIIQDRSLIEWEKKQRDNKQKR